MATPTPRSYTQILGDLVSTFLVRQRLPKLKAGSPVLTVLEAAAQSDARSTQDLFAALNSQSIDRVSGTALDAAGRSEGVIRRAERAANGSVSFIDTSFAKKSTRVSPARAAPIAGSTTLHLVDCDGWPTSGSVYLGRDGDNYEGPVPYSALVDSGSYWTMTLSSPLQRFHPQQEGVVLAQGGDRSIPAGQRVSTARGLSTPSVEFATLYPAVIPDGETTVGGVVVVCTVAGTIGNVPQGAISTVASPPFVGCSATNPTSFVTGVNTEGDNDYRERIKADRANRTRATDAALASAAVGVSSVEDARRVVSAAIVRAEGETTTLVIDDGTGYEERSDGVALEPLVDSAIGGERSFRLSFRPIARAFAASSKTAPFSLADNSYLGVSVGGVRYEHYFSSSSFRDITAASAYEVAASINANPALPIAARTINGGTGVAIFARSDVNEDIQVFVPTSGEDANEVLGFTTNAIYTLRLYKNDRLLSKDGRAAVASGASVSQWSTLSGPETLTISVDGTPAVPYNFTDQDFIDAATGFSTLGINSLSAWASVLNARIPGITATVEGDLIVLTSNAGRSARGKIVISGGSLVSKGMFDTQTALGADSDYSMNVNTGEIRLRVALSAGDSLVAGSFNTRAFLESAVLTPVSLVSTAQMWIVSDGGAEQILHGVSGAGTYDLVKTSSGAWGERWQLTANAGTPFEHIASGDWMILWDSAVASGLRGIWRIAEAATNTAIAFDSPVTGVADAFGFSFANGDVRFVRSDVQPQPIEIAAGTNYTATAFANAISLRGAAATTYRTNRLRLRTNTFAADGDISVVARNAEAAKLGIAETRYALENLDGHLASAEARSEAGNTPTFNIHAIVTQSSGLSDLIVAPGSDTNMSYNKIVVGEKALDNVGTTARWGNNQAFRSAVASMTLGGSNTLTTRNAAMNKWAVDDVLYFANPYAIAPEDSLGVVIDGNTETQRFVLPMARTLAPVGSTYGLTNEFTDDDAGASLTQSFGLGYSFNDFAAYMRARVKTHSADATKRILWRWKRMGPEGEKARLRYVYPTAPDQALSVALDTMPTATAAFPTANEFSLVSVALPSGALKTGYSIRSSTRIGIGSTAVSGVDAITIVVGFTVSSAQRTTNVTTLTLTMPSGLYALTDHNYQIGDVIYVNSTNPNYSSGAKTVTARTATTVSYAETAANFGPTANIGTVSSDTAPAGFSGASPAITAGDIIRFDNLSLIPALVRNRAFRISNVGAQFIQGYSDYNYTGTQNTTVTWSSLGDASGLKIYPLNAGSSTATAIAAAVNALGDECPVTATTVGTGGGTISLSSREEALSEDALVEYVAFADGINWVQTTTSPGSMAGNYQLTFKRPITAGLSTDSDWANEEVKIVPITSASIVRWMTTPAISGLFGVAVVEAARNGHAPQIVSVTPGTSGSVQVQGGGANAAVATLVGSAIVDASASPAFCVVGIDSADAGALRGDHWVRLTNSERHVKSGLITSLTAITGIASDGTVSGVSPAIRTTLATGGAGSIEIRPEGEFMAYIGVDGTLAAEGDWLEISGVSAPNAGLHRIVRATPDAVWIANAGVAEEVGSGVATWAIYDATSLVPGDRIAISSTAWGAANMGVWTVEAVTASNSFKLNTSTAQGAIGALGAEAANFVVTGDPLTCYKQIYAVDPRAGGQTAIKLRGAEHGALLGEGFGTVLSAMDKLSFPTALAQGADGYRYNTGLIGEVNRVIYGDPRDPATYPGVAGAGVKVNLAGPLVRRVTVSLGIRLRLGVSPTDAIRQVRAAVSGAINDTGIGRSIPISSLVAAAMQTTGVLAVSVLSPVYSSSNDLIPIQPDEKPLVLDAEQDISVSIVGE